LTNKGPLRPLHLGDLLQEIVNHVSHGPQGQALAIMSDASVTLPQVLMLRRLTEQRADSPSALARSLNMSASAVSQMLDRLFQLQLVRRTENPHDRRKKRITATPKAKWLIERLGRARSAEYAGGISRLSPALRRELAIVLSRVLAELQTLDDPGHERASSDPAASFFVGRGMPGMRGRNGQVARGLRSR
jgi:DNA-binding MarR family transcriptional regulator